jgi:hypothetical protein
MFLTALLPMVKRQKQSKYPLTDKQNVDIYTTDYSAWERN